MSSAEAYLRPSSKLFMVAKLPLQSTAIVTRYNLLKTLAERQICTR